MAAVFMRLLLELVARLWWQWLLGPTGIRQVVQLGSSINVQQHFLSVSCNFCKWLADGVKITVLVEWLQHIAMALWHNRLYLYAADGLWLALLVIQQHASLTVCVLGKLEGHCYL